MNWNLSDKVSIIKNNIDHETDATFGCHENYLVSREFPFNYQGLGLLMPFLVTRQVFTGAGRIGMARTADGWIGLDDIEGGRGNHSGSSAEEPVIYQISQRPDYIVNDFFEWVQHNRAIVNTRDEPLADPERFRRLHLLMGDSNMAEETTLLKMGDHRIGAAAHRRWPCSDRAWILTTLFRPCVESHATKRREWMVTLSSGKHLSALDIQEEFWEAASKHYAGQDEETDWVLTHWESVVKDLTKRL